MSYHRNPVYPKARKEHICIACGHIISIGDKYTQQTGFHEGKAYRNHYHDECYDDLSLEGEFEFIPGSLEPPEGKKPPEGASGHRP